MAAQLDWDRYDDLQAHIRYLESEARRGFLPSCVTHSYCEECPLGARCPVASDNDFISLLEHFSTLYAAAEQLKERRLVAVSRVLQKHKLPMHWELVARIIDEEEPELFPSHRSVLGILVRNPSLFTEDSPGSYFLGTPPVA